MASAVILDAGGPAFLARRTERALGALSLEVPVVRRADELSRVVAGGARWIVRAGAFPSAPPPALAPSATGLPVVAFGAPLPPPRPSCALAPLVAEARAWLEATGGEHSGAARLPFATLLLDETMARALASATPAAQATTHVEEALSRAHARLVRLSALDAPYAEELRVAEIVTSLQIGGAEKIARTLALHLPRAGVSARLVGLGSPTRTRLEPVDAELDLGGTRLSADARVARLVSELLRWGADLAHAHLFGPDVLGALAAAGFRPAVTIHNAAAGFPAGTASLSRDETALVVACASAVEEDLVAAGVATPIRTVRNGIEPFPLASRQSASALRAAWGLAPETVVLLVVANPRPQKRLDRVAPIAARLEERMGRPVAVVWAGAPSRSDERAQELGRLFTRSLERASIRAIGLGAEPSLGPVYGACDALLCTSDWEGLSLAQLEALAAGLPMAVTDVGGAREIADACSPGRIASFAPDSPADDVARAIEGLLGVPRRDADPSALPDRFSTRSMVRGYAGLLRRAAGARAPEDARELDLVLVTNNFSPGGAQSSARRLLVELTRRGRRVLAVTLQEDEARPTPGLVALRDAGIDVLVLPRVSAAESTLALADTIDRRGARTVVFWNAIAEHKVRLCDLLFDVDLYDVSPGEMYFDSLARYFERPCPEVAVDSPMAYGRRLSGGIVKFEEERARAEATLGAPIHVVPNGVPLRGRPARPRAAGPLRFGTSVRIHPHKRLDRLLDAFAQVHRADLDAELWVAGTADAECDDHFDELRARSRDLPVRWVGFREDVGSFLDELDAFVLVAEPAGCPNASLEALAAGLPTIATDVGGMREQLGEGAGLLAPRDDVAGLADHLRAVAESEALRADLSARALERVRARFSIATMADRYERILLGDHRRIA